MSLVTISFDGRPPVSLGTAVVDPLTIKSVLLCKMLRRDLCARSAHLFSEQTQRHGEEWLLNDLDVNVQFVGFGGFLGGFILG